MKLRCQNFRRELDLPLVLLLLKLRAVVVNMRCDDIRRNLDLRMLLLLLTLHEHQSCQVEFMAKFLAMKRQTQADANSHQTQCPALFASHLQISSVIKKMRCTDFRRELHLLMALLQ